MSPPACFDQNDKQFHFILYYKVIILAYVQIILAAVFEAVKLLLC
jgi:hypothetical protein